jgi:hypothetical protein
MAYSAILGLRTDLHLMDKITPGRVVSSTLAISLHLVLLPF